MNHKLKRFKSTAMFTFVGGALIINLPGKPAAIEECLAAVFPAVPYCVKLIGGPFIESTSAAPKVYVPAGA